MLQSIKNGLKLIALALLLTSCSHSKRHPMDPLEPLNREIFGFNQTMDKALIKPVAYIYMEYLPPPLQAGIGNFFDNLRDITNVGNDLLQLKFNLAVQDLMRLLVNSTVGIGGVFDPATALGLEKHKQDFGQTLNYWGYHKSIYLVLPLLGPSTVRDAIGLAVDYEALSIWPWIESDWKYAFLGLDALDLRARMLAHETVLKTLALDDYSFFRNAYLQRRDYLSKGGKIDAAGDIDPYEAEFGGENEEQPHS